MKQTITITSYNYSTNQVDTVAEDISLRDIAKSAKAEDIAGILENYLNSYTLGSKIGVDIGKLFGDGNAHRTIQGQFVNFALGLLYGYAEVQDPKYSDLRNQEAVRTAHKIKELLEDGTLGRQAFI